MVSVLIFQAWGLPCIGQWLAQPSQIEYSDAIVVLGGGAQRNEQGIQLYQMGIADEYWLTGYVPDMELPSSYAGSRVEFAIDNGNRMSDWQTAKKVGGFQVTSRFQQSKVPENLFVRMLVNPSKTREVL